MARGTHGAARRDLQKSPAFFSSLAPLSFVYIRNVCGRESRYRAIPQFRGGAEIRDNGGGREGEGQTINRKIQRTINRTNDAARSRDATSGDRDRNRRVRFI